MPPQHFGVHLRCYSQLWNNVMRFSLYISKPNPACGVTIEMKPLQQYFHLVLPLYTSSTLNPWTKSYGTTFQIRPSSLAELSYGTIYDAVKGGCYS